MDNQINDFYEDYSIDSKEHFALAPKDIVKINLRYHIQKIVDDIKRAKKSTYGELEIDDVTGKVNVNSNGTTSDNDNVPDKESVVDFLKLLKSNGALDELKNVNPNVRRRIAAVILRILQKSKGAKTIKEDEDLLLKESYILLYELSTKGTNINNKNAVKKNVTNKTAPKPVAKPVAKAAPKSAPKTTPKAVAKTAPKASPKSAPKSVAKPAAAPAPTQAPVQQQPSVKLEDTPMSEILKDPTKYGLSDSDPKIAYIKDLFGSYNYLTKIPNVLNSDILAAVENVDDQEGTVDVQLLQKKSTTPDGKSQYGDSGKVFTVPQDSVVKRTAAEVIKKKGLWSKFFGGN